MKKNTIDARARGFTLIEMIVSVGLFAIVMLVCVGALLSLVNANRKAQALQSVMNNLNIALDGIVRNAREGSDYDGSAACSGNSDSSPKDCTSGEDMNLTVRDISFDYVADNVPKIKIKSNHQHR